MSSKSQRVAIVRSCPLHCRGHRSCCSSHLVSGQKALCPAEGLAGLPLSIGKAGGSSLDAQAPCCALVAYEPLPPLARDNFYLPARPRLASRPCPSPSPLTRIHAPSHASPIGRFCCGWSSLSPPRGGCQRTGQQGQF